MGIQQHSQHIVWWVDLSAEIICPATCLVQTTYAFRALGDWLLTGNSSTSICLQKDAHAFACRPRIRVFST